MGGEFCPMPPVKISVSSPPMVATSAAKLLAGDMAVEGNGVSGSLIGLFTLEQFAHVPLVPDTPSRPDS